eukprot:COSAG05_NODE_7415_length_813_cov_1.689076_2_plen_48_part_01
MHENLNISVKIGRVVSQRKFGFFLAKTLPPTPTLMVAARRLRLFWFGL